MTPQESNLPKASEVRGLELMAERDNLIYHAAHAHGPEAKTKFIAAVDAWDSARTDADWEAIRIAVYGPNGKAIRLKLVQVLEDVAPIGQRR